MNANLRAFVPKMRLIVGVDIRLTDERGVVDRGALRDEGGTRFPSIATTPIGRIRKTDLCSAPMVSEVNSRIQVRR